MMAKSEIVLGSFAVGVNLVVSKMLQRKIAEKGSSITEGWQMHSLT